MEKERFFGKIFLSNGINDKIDGVWLNIANNGIYVECPMDIGENQAWDIIHGEFIGLDKVTFVKAYVGGGQSGAGSSWCRIHVSYILKRCQIGSYSDLHFKQAK